MEFVTATRIHGGEVKDSRKLAIEWLATGTPYIAIVWMDISGMNAKILTKQERCHGLSAIKVITWLACKGAEGMLKDVMLMV